MFTALLDTNVIWPSLRRDFLLSLAIEGLYRPLWSEAILEELEYHEQRKLETRGMVRADAQRKVGSLIAALRALKSMSARYVSPARTPSQIIDVLESRYDMDETAALVRSYL